MPIASFSKPTNLPSFEESLLSLENELSKTECTGSVWEDWRQKVRIGYENLIHTLWQVAREFDVRGYGVTLREKLTTKWCDCGCSTDHLGEICERTVREEEEDSKIRSGKEREWDGRGETIATLRTLDRIFTRKCYSGSGIYGWQTEEEEDIWEGDLDYGGLEPDECDGYSEMTVAELIEWRYIKAERAKEQVKETIADLWNNHLSTFPLYREIKHFGEGITRQLSSSIVQPIVLNQNYRIIS